MSADIYKWEDESESLDRSIRYALESHWDDAIEDGRVIHLSEKHIPILESARNKDSDADIDMLENEIQAAGSVLLIGRY